MPEDAVREALAELASRRDQLKHMIHAESCRLRRCRSPTFACVIDHLEMLNAEDKQIHKMMLTMCVNASTCSATGTAEDHHGDWLEVYAKPHRLCPELGLVHNKQPPHSSAPLHSFTRAAP